MPCDGSLGQESQGNACAGAGDDERFQSLTLPSGRVLAYGEYGPASGLPLLYCHGFPSSRLEARLLAPTARALGIRLIAADRPGYGRSDPHPGRDLNATVRDLVVLLDTLGLAQVGLIGVSGGGPSALAMLALYPERISRAALVGALGPPWAIAACRSRFMPLARWAFGAVVRIPGLAPALARIGLELIRMASPRVLSPGFLAPADRAVLAEPGVRQILMRARREAFREGTAGSVQDLLLYINHWGFALDAISCPVTIWHGTEDTIVPVGMARQIQRAVPRADVRIIDGEGHFSVPIRYQSAIIHTLFPGLAP